MATKTYKLRAGAESEVAGYMIPLSNGKTIGFWDSREKYSTDNIDIQKKIEKDPLFRAGIVVLAETIEEVKQSKPATMNVKKIFIVHGRDEEMLKNAKKHIKTLGFEPIVLRNQASKGDTVIEKFERCAKECVYAIALLSPDDEGRLKAGGTTHESRARQNVILEYGYMWGKLGRDKIAMILKGGVEEPSDIKGLVYIPYKRGWVNELKKELEETGLLEKKVIENRVLTSCAEKPKSLLDKTQVKITKKDDFLTPIISANFPTTMGRSGVYHVGADQIKGTRSEFISTQNKLYIKSYPWLYANGLNHGDIILGMIWDYWQKEKEHVEIIQAH